jgi:hypothetical protein
MSFFFAITVFSTTIFGIFNAILIGEGQSSKLITTDLLINGIVILLAVLFMIYQSEFLFIITPAVVLLILSPIFISKIKRYYINASNDEKKSYKIKGFVISSFFSSLSAPVAMYIFRSLLFFGGGYSEATEFIIVQKIIAAILIPTMLYLNNYVQPKYFIVNRDSFRNELINDSKRILFLGVISVLLPLPFLHFIEINLFDDNIKISLSLFVLIGIAEMSRNLSILLSYYCNVEGMWKTYIFGEILFILTYSIALGLVPHNKINFGLIYLFSILSTVFYYALMVKKKMNLEIKLD